MKENLNKTMEDKDQENQRHFYPNGYSDAGFLAWGEKIEDVIQKDSLVLEKLGYDYETISSDLEK